MDKLKCLIVDDEPLAVNLLEGYVAKTPFLECIGKCNSAIEAINVINSQKIDLIFLDIQMPELTGIQLSHTLSKEIKIIFTTAFSEYAIDGFKVNALDYLLKPFNYVEFLNAANKAKEWFHLNNSQQTSSQISENEFIFVRSEYKQVKIFLNEVLYFEGFKDYLKIWLKDTDKPVMTIMSLKTLESKLSANQFMRIHRSFIIALDKIQSIERNQVIINGARITIAEQYKEKFQIFLEKKLF